jgi:hypothetical protein
MQFSPITFIAYQIFTCKIKAKVLEHYISLHKNFEILGSYQIAAVRATDDQGLCPSIQQGGGPSVIIKRVK